jgi:hypothetical protein
MMKIPAKALKQKTILFKLMDVFRTTKQQQGRLSIGGPLLLQWLRQVRLMLAECPGRDSLPGLMLG